MKHEHSHTHRTADSEAQALLKYMADHNAHHAGELEALAASLPAKAAAHVREAIELLNASTQKLREAIEETEG